MPHAVGGNAQAEIDSGLACLIILVRFFGLQADPAHLKREFGSSDTKFDTTDILRATKSIGLKTKSVSTDKSRLQKIQFPAIAKHTDGHYFVVAKLDGDKILIHDPLEQRPLLLPIDMFINAWTGELILFTKRAGLLGGFKKFDFS